MKAAKDAEASRLAMQAAAARASALEAEVKTRAIAERGEWNIACLTKEMNVHTFFL